MKHSKFVLFTTVAKMNRALDGLESVKVTVLTEFPWSKFLTLRSPFTPWSLIMGLLSGNNEGVINLGQQG